jgi:hypothetical protein
MAKEVRVRQTGRTGFSIFGAAGGADVPSFLLGRRITASSRCALFARLFWSAEGPSFASVAGAGAGGVTTADADRRRGSRRVVSQTGSSEASGSDADARAAQFLREAGQWIGTPPEVPGRSGSRGLRERRFARRPVRGWFSRKRRRSHRLRFGARQRFRSRPPFGLQRPHVSFA